MDEQNKKSNITELKAQSDEERLAAAIADKPRLVSVSKAHQTEAVGVSYLGDFRPDAAVQVIRILYTNYKGETSLRVIRPEKIYFGSTEWHSSSQWLLEAYDLEKEAIRAFALKDIKAWLES